MMRVAIVGGGAAGLLAAAHLRRSKPEAQITLIDASGRPGTGAAYRTKDPTHLLNVPAHRMSAWPDDPDHFCRWLDERAVTPVESFAPRLAYGRYLQEQLAGADVRIETAEAVGLVPGRPTRVSLNDGRSLSADAVVLATGRPEGGMPESLERAFAPVLAAGTDGKVVVDPWAPGALAALGACRPASVLVIGSGLTGVDVALHLIARGATVTLLSRHGALPRRFRATGAPTELPNLDALAAESSLEQLRAALAADLAHAREAGSDWRQVIDALRPRTARLWRSLGWEDQRRFLREDLRQWDVLRHRMPPTIADAIYAAIDSGDLIIEAGEVADVSLHGSGVELVVTTGDGSVRRRGDAVVVATGAAWDRRSLQRSPLWANLLATDVASLHPCGVGVRLDTDGYLIDGAGGTVPDIVCLGSIRQGEMWETTAIPEIRDQAAAIAELLADDTRDRPVRAPSLVTIAPELSGAPASYAEGVRRLLSVQDGASVAFAAAVAEDPHVLRLGRREKRGVPTRRGSRVAHRELVQRGVPLKVREVTLRAAVAHDPVRQPFQPGSMRVGLVVHVRQRMRGVAVAWIEFECGVSQVGCVIPEALLRSAVSAQAEIPWRLAVHASEPLDVLPCVRQRVTSPCEGNRRREYKQCDCVVRYAVEVVDECAGAHRVPLLAPRRDGLDVAAVFIAPMCKRRTRSSEMAGDRVRAARAVGPFRGNHRERDVRTRVVRCLVDAGSLAWRARLHPDWVTPPDPMPVLAEVGSLAYAPQTPIAFHALLVLAAANDPAAIRAITVPGATDAQATTLRLIGEGLIALTEGEPRAALDYLLESLAGLPSIGGSRVQQEVVLETALAAMLQLGAPGQAARLLSRHRTAPGPQVTRGAVN